MTYLSKILINPLRSAGRRYLANPQVVHAAVLGGLPQQPSGGRVLWRMDAITIPNGHGAVQGELLVLTEATPSFAHIVEQAGYPGAAEAEPLVREYRPLLERIGPGREFAFRVRVNPVQSVRTPQSPSSPQRRVLETADGRHRGFRVAHRTVRQQTEWLLGRCAAHWGFVVPDGGAGAPDVRIIDRARLDFTKSSSSGQRRRVQLQTATFEGRLRITDPARFRAVLLDGIGPAKAYGCGLLTLAPLAARDG